MTKVGMDLAIVAAAQTVSKDHLTRNDISIWDRAVFIAGMREAAKIAAAERLDDTQPGEGDEAYQMAVTHIVAAIESQADELSKP